MDLAKYLKFFAALLFVLALIGGSAWLVRRFGLAGAIPVRRPRRERRLHVVEALALDSKRKLVLIRRDEQEHLVLLGLQNDIVVESGIRRPAAAEPGRTLATPSALRPGNQPS